MVICAQCGAENPEGFRFCGQCTAPLAEPQEPRQSRKVVTALFCDVTGSTSLGEELDPEVLRGVLNRYFGEIRSTIERHGGTVEKFIGDAVMAVFGIPRVHEDDALRAVRAAAEIRERLPAVAEEIGVALRFRTGLNTGAVLMGQGENLAIGDPVNVAARLEQAAAPGEIILGEETLRLVRDAVEVEALEPLELKGKSEPVAAFRLLTVDPAAPGFARHFEVALVGREDELRVLGEAWSRVLRESGCHLFTLLGPAGVGKSRLVAELLTDVERQASVLRGRCLHYGEGITFWPLVEALMPVGEPARPVLDRLTGGGAMTPEELFWDVRRLLETLASERAVILHIDDLQWAEPTLLDLLDHVADLSRGTPILLLCTARPELLEDRPAWAGGKLNATTVLLEPLGATDSETLLAQLGDELDPESRARVISASEGNPLFLEEMAALAHERGTVEVPPTIQALLAARLERLGIEERALLERGAVEGEVFHRLAVRALADERLAATVELRLAGLVRKELIRPHPATLSGDDAFRFRHLLIRDAAYDGLPKSTRAELHERFARWLEQTATGLLELDEIAGWHLEQAVRYRQELSRGVGAELARDAASHLHAAGRRAVARSDIAAAANLLERALALAPADDPVHARIALDLAEALVEAGQYQQADGLLAIADHDPAIASLVILTRIELLTWTNTEEALRLIDATASELLEQLTREGDHRGIAKTHMVLFHRHWLESRATSASEHARLAAVSAARAGEEVVRTRALLWYSAALLWGHTEPDAIARELDQIAKQNPGPRLHAILDIGNGELSRLRGDFATARRLIEQGRDAELALGQPIWGAADVHYLAHVHFSEGDAGAALRSLQASDAALAEHGERAFRSTTQAYLARAHAALGDWDAARAACGLVDELSSAADSINFEMTHSVRALLALEGGDAEAAERWARSAVEYAFKTDFPDTQARAKLGLARVLSSLGRRDEALTEARDALAIQQAKRDRPGIAEAQAVLDEL